MTEKESVNSNIINHFSLHHVAVEIQAHVATSPTDHVRRGDVHVRKRILAASQVGLLEVAICSQTHTARMCSALHLENSKKALIRRASRVAGVVVKPAGMP